MSHPTLNSAKARAVALEEAAKVCDVIAEQQKAFRDRSTDSKVAHAFNSGYGTAVICASTIRAMFTRKDLA